MRNMTVPDERMLFQHRSPCALIVDSDADTRALYRMALALAGWEVVEAVDGRDAMTKALVEPPTLIITELRVPLVDGYALCDILRRDAATRSVPILIVTAEAHPSELDRIRKAGADAVLVKPTPPDSLVREVQRLITRSANAHRSAAPSDRAAQSGASAQMRPDGHRTALAKSHARFKTTTPSLRPPALSCPSCDGALKYQESHIGGVSDRHSEQWDYFVCETGCGTFQYRQRTRKVRRVD
jgi:DNA-binding response OmpR family regulator